MASVTARCAPPTLERSLARLHPDDRAMTILTPAEVAIAQVRPADRPTPHRFADRHGDLPLDCDESFTEETPYRPRTPYNASKAATNLPMNSLVPSLLMLPSSAR